MNTTAIENHNFKTEVSELLHLVVHALYSHKDIFLRELISNASDALDKVRFESLQDNTLLGSDTVLKIKLIRDDKNNTLTISDNGIGITEEQLRSKNSYGIISMKERTTALGGIFTITGQARKGTTISLTIPAGLS